MAERLTLQESCTAGNRVLKSGDPLFKCKVGGGPFVGKFL